ncbi:MAG: ATP-binding protein [Nitrospira sp.]
MRSLLSINHEVQSFLKDHPREAGWITYHCCRPLVRNLYLHYLVDWLLAVYPETVTAFAAVKESPAEELFGAKENVESGNPDRQQDTHQEPRSEGWVGSIEVEWNDSAIHFYSPFMEQCLAHEPLVLIAVKSNATLRTLLRKLKEYGRTRERNNGREILVVNGDNIPVIEHPWDDLVLPAPMMRDIRTNVEGFFASPERYASLGIPHRRGFLFTGPPGCGKTLTLKTLASNTPAKFISVLGTAEVDDDMLRRALDLAEGCTPAVVLLEDLDRIVQARGVSMSHFLNLMDGLKVLKGVLVIATCNEPDKLDLALIHRPSRFDRVWRFDLPTYEQRLELLRRKGGTFFSESALEMTARRSEGFSMAYVQEIVVSALLECTDDSLPPSDDHLFKSLDVLRIQRKEALKPGESMEERESVGFCVLEKSGQ